MGKSKEFDRDGDADVEKVVSPKTGPMGLLPILYIGASVLIIIAVAIWWAMS